MKLDLLSLLLSGVALAWGWWNHRRAGEAEARLATLRGAHYRLADEAREALGRLEGELQGLRRQLRATQGGTLFEPTTTVGEAVALDPRAADVLAAFHIGGCGSCAVSDDTTLQFAAGSNGQDVDKVLAALNKLPTASEAEVATLLQQRPNVQISL